MDGLQRKVTNFQRIALATVPSGQPLNNNDISKSSEEGVKCYVVAGKNVLQNWKSHAAATILLPDAWADWTSKSMRVMADELAFATQAVVLVPNIFRGVPCHAPPPVTGPSDNRASGTDHHDGNRNGPGNDANDLDDNGEDSENQPTVNWSVWRDTQRDMRNQMFNDIVAALHFARTEYGCSTVSLAGVGYGAGLALEATCDLHDLARLAQATQLYRELVAHLPSILPADKDNENEIEAGGSVDTKATEFDFPVINPQQLMQLDKFMRQLHHSKVSDQPKVSSSSAWSAASAQTAYFAADTVLLKRFKNAFIMPYIGARAYRSFRDANASKEDDDVELVDDAHLALDANGAGSDPEISDLMHMLLGTFDEKGLTTGNATHKAVQQVVTPALNFSPLHATAIANATATATATANANASSADNGQGLLAPEEEDDEEEEVRDRLLHSEWEVCYASALRAASGQQLVGLATGTTAQSPAAASTTIGKPMLQTPLSVVLTLAQVVSLVPRAVVALYPNRCVSY
jgi:hypothetical protein